MPRGVYNRNTGSNVTSIAHVGKGKMISPNIFTNLSWWKELNESEQKTILAEGEQLAFALYNYGHARLAVGEHLSKIHEVLQPHNLFEKFLRNFHFSKRTAYRYIAGFKNASNLLPEPVLKRAMARGFNIVGESDQKPLGIYTDAAKSLPIPANVDESKADVWLDQVEVLRKKARSTEMAAEGEDAFGAIVPQDLEALLKECFRFVNSRIRKCDAKGRVELVQKLTGMLLTQVEINRKQTIAPMPVPEDFIPQRGRPKEQAAA